MGTKRSGTSLVLATQEPKRSKSDLIAYTNRDKALIESGVRRTSNLMTPIMLLEGHEGEIFTTEFHPDGDLLLSSGFDRQIYVWNVYGECENIMVMSGHSGAVLEAHFSTDGSNVYTCATDKTVAIWDIVTGQRVRRLKGHTNFVNTVHCTRRGVQMLCSGSDDRSIRIWDARKKNAIHTLETPYQVTGVCFNDTGEQVISGGIDNEIKIWDVRKQQQVLHRLRGHTDTITGISLSPDGSYLLSNSMDNSLRIWDIRPYVPSERCVKIFQGHQHNFEKNLLRCCWSPDGSKISAGSADRHVYIWDTTSRRILYKLPGHNGSVNDVDFHPKEPLILSASSDKTLYLGEIED
ncbi:U5 small nuclear ribonucleoprotein 40 kDa protein [Anastrepha ludens]|uniref:U5 small nuclear ribonucleoprotein 40 kDa protein n=1 Tax=Anastrepha ludens TaxID=28586 RepID=UPI0023B186FD|nr:U5 small nuclear ribonucleoprotein 40 kDa protein [Anastrepha ludens]